MTANGRRRPRPLALVAAFFVVGSLAFACSTWRRRSAEPIASGACRGCNVLLLTIDTLRRDRVAAFGGRPGLTPHLDSLAAEGLRLTRAYAAAPLTLPSHSSIMTAVSPPVHGVRNNSLFRLGATLPTLAGVLKGAGYRTGAFVGAFVLDARFGLDRGFDVYDDRYGESRPGDAAESAERRAEDVINPASAWILRNPQSAVPNPQSASSPWFAWIHLYDPHEPYRAPEPYASQYEPYDAEVPYADAMVGRLLDALRAAGQLDRTLIVFTADHGESLGEQGESTHGVFVYDAVMRVPAFFWANKRFGDAAYDGVSRLIDLAPTALDVLGITRPPQFEGESLLPALSDSQAPGRVAYLEAMDANLTRNWAPLTGVVSGSYKLIDLPDAELYDLASDPGETANLYSRNAERARLLGSLLRDRVADFTTRGSSPARVTLDSEARQRLQALGYVAASAAPAARAYGDADDPKRLISVANELNRALADFNSGMRESAMSTVAGIMRAHPSFTTAVGVYASMQRDSGDLAGAITTLDDLLRRGIADQSVMVVLAGYLQEAGARERAAALLEAVISAHPDYAEAYNSLGVAYSRLGRHADAQAAFGKVLELDPTSAKAYENIGVDALAAGDLARATQALTHALSLDAGLPNTHNALAAVYFREKRLDDAAAEWKAALQLNPRLFDALYNLGTSLYDAGRHDDARPYLQRFVKEAPRGRYGADIGKIERLLAR